MCDERGFGHWNAANANAGKQEAEEKTGQVRGREEERAMAKA